MENNKRSCEEWKTTKVDDPRSDSDSEDYGASAPSLRLGSEPNLNSLMRGTSAYSVQGPVARSAPIVYGCGGYFNTPLSFGNEGVKTETISSATTEFSHGMCSEAAKIKQGRVYHLHVETMLCYCAGEGYDCHRTRVKCGFHGDTTNNGRETNLHDKNEEMDEDTKGDILREPDAIGGEEGERVFLKDNVFMFNRGGHLSITGSALYTIMFIIIIFGLIQRTKCLTAYDCVAGSNRTTTLDLTEVGECGLSKTTYKNGTTTNIMLLQAIERVDVSVVQCKIKVSSHVFRCGSLDSIGYGQQWLEWNSNVYVKPEDCKRAYENGAIVIDGHLLTIERDVQISKIVKRNGEVHSDGWCKGESFNFKGKTYDKTVRSSNYDITIRKFNISHLTSANNIVMPGGVRFKTHAGHGDDIDEGTFVWEFDNDDFCETKLQRIYTGPAFKSVPWNESSSSPSIYIIESEKSSQYGGFYTQGSEGMCGRTFLRTQKEDLYILDDIGDDVDNFPKIGAKALVEIDINVDLAAAVGFAGLKASLSINEATTGMKRAICRLEKKRLEDLLYTIRHHPQGGLLNTHGMENAYVIVSGAAATITPCLPVSVELRGDMANCTQEIPVYYGEQKMFVEPFTMMLLQNATIMPCTTLAPVRWKIDGSWYCSTPKVIDCTEPTKLGVGEAEIIVPEVRPIGIGMSTYSPEDRRNFYTRVYMENTRASFTNEASLIVSGSVSGGTSYLSLIGAGGREELMNEMREEFFPFIAWMGKASGMFAGLCFLIAIGAAVFDGLIKALWIITNYGCSLRLMGVFLNTGFLFISVPYKIGLAFIRIAVTGANDSVSLAERWHTAINQIVGYPRDDKNRNDQGGNGDDGEYVKMDNGLYPTNELKVLAGEERSERSDAHAVHHNLLPSQTTAEILSSRRDQTTTL